MCNSYYKVTCVQKTARILLEPNPLEEKGVMEVSYFFLPEKSAEQEQNY